MSTIYTIIVTYNSMRWAEKCFGSLRASSVPTNVVVVDNGSTDGTVVYVKEHFPDVHIIETGENLGFAKANNIGIRYAIDRDADYVFLLNHDAWVENNTLVSLIQTMESGERIGIISPIHLTGDYSAIDSSFRKFMPDSFSADYERQALKPMYEINYVNAAAWLMNVVMIREVGGFDTYLFKHYGEDNNLCQRVKYFGWHILVNTRVTICHDRRERIKDDNYQEKAFGEKVYLLAAKSKYGDINVAYNMQWKTCREYILMLGWGFLCQFKRAEIHRNLYLTYKKVIHSRRVNKNGGLSYL